MKGLLCGKKLHRVVNWVVVDMDVRWRVEVESTEMEEVRRFSFLLDWAGSNLKLPVVVDKISSSVVSEIIVIVLVLVTSTIDSVVASLIQQDICASVEVRSVTASVSLV